MEGLGTLPCFFLFEQVVDAKGRLVQREKGGHVPIPSRAQGEGGDPNPKEKGSFCEKAVLLRREKAVCFATARRWSVCRCENCCASRPRIVGGFFGRGATAIALAQPLAGGRG